MMLPSIPVMTPSNALVGFLGVLFWRGGGEERRERCPLSGLGAVKNLKVDFHMFVVGIGRGTFLARNPVSLYHWIHFWPKLYT